MESLPLCDSACVEAATRLFNSRNVADWTMKRNIHLRIHGVPPKNPFSGSNIPRPADIGKLISFQGLAMKVSMMKVVEFRREMRCKRCGFLNYFDAEYNQYNIISLRRKCENPDEICNSKSFTEELENKKLNLYRKDYQEIKLQEPFNVKRGTTGLNGFADFVSVTLEDDLVDVAKAGDEVTIWYVFLVFKFVRFVIFFFKLCSLFFFKHRSLLS